MELEQTTNKKLDEIIKLLDSINNKQEEFNDYKKEFLAEGKVTFSYNVNDRMVAILPNLNKIMSALEDFSNYRRTLYKYDVPGEIFYNSKTKDVKNLEELPHSVLGEGYTSYVEVQDVINKIDDILDDIYVLIDKYWY